MRKMAGTGGRDRRNADATPSAPEARRREGVSWAGVEHTVTREMRDAGGQAGRNGDAV